jgi:hypothetical protein
MVWYFTGNPCPHGHVDRRAVINSTCYKCSSENSKKRYAENPQPKTRNPEAAKRYGKRYYQENKEHVDAKNIAWAEANPTRAWAGRFLRSIRRQKKAGRKVTVNLTVDQIVEVIEKSGGRCALSGILYRRNGKQGAQWNSPSFDRIDSFRGYEPGNIRIILQCFNMFRGQMSDNDMISAARKLVNYHDSSKEQTKIAA